jgi:hypothetical protein
MNPWPVYYQWDGEHMIPLDRFRHRCDEQFVVGETYRLIVEEERSSISHNHFFAALHEAWKNLPEEVAERFPSAEHLRKWALIKNGYADERTIVCDTPNDAKKTAAVFAHFNEHGIAVVKGRVVSILTAKSQSVRAMNKKVFQESKQAVLDTIAGMIGVAPEKLQAESRPHA